MDTRIYDDLRARSEAGKIVFRIWAATASSSSKAPNDTRHATHPGDSSTVNDATPTDGFSADHPFFHNMAKDSFRRIDIDLSPSPRHVWIQESVVKQVKGDLAWIERSVKRDIELDMPEPPHSRRRSSGRVRIVTGSRSCSARTAEEDSESVSMATRATAGSLIDLDETETSVMDELASIFTDNSSISGTVTPRATVQPGRVGQPDPEEDLSPWIVTHGNIDWTIHRITRLLTRNTASNIHLTVIKQDQDSLEHYTSSAKHLDLVKANQAWGTAERQTLTEAVRFAKNSKEVLFYGRIFPESCEVTYTWTRNSYPFQLPWYMFLRPPPGQRIPQSWLNGLVWHGEMPFVLAEVRMLDRQADRPLSHGVGKCPGGEADTSRTPARRGVRRNKRGGAFRAYPPQMTSSWFYGDEFT